MNTSDVLRIDLNQFKRDHWTDQEHANAELVVDFVQHLMNDHDFDYVREHFGTKHYLQHNRSMRDGLEGVLDYISNLIKRYPDYTYDVKHIYVDGDMVIVQSHSTIQKKHRGNPDKGVNIFDAWRVHDGAIVEHWDAIQAVDGFMRTVSLMTGGKKQNENTLY